MIPLSNFGKDHWSTFAYVETLVVDNKGIIVPNPLKMRTCHKTHGVIVNPIDECKYPTKLKDGTLVTDHDDWDCLDDAVQEGLLIDIRTGSIRQFKLTDKGRIVANLLREHKSKGGKFSNFVAVL